MKFSSAAAIFALCAPALAAPQFTVPSFGSTTGSTGTGTGSTFSIPSSLSGFGSTPGFGSTTGTTGTGTTSAATSGSDTENDVTNNAGCKTVTVIFARGTSESGNVGTVAGPPFFTSLQKVVSSVALQGVDYPASAAGNANQGADGGPTMQKLVTTALSQCPSTKIVLSGYSQGAMVVHYAAKSLTASQIGAVVLFGDPENGSAVGSVPAADVKEFCASGDSICNGSGGFAITSAHLSYGSDADAAASFVKSTLGL